MDDRASKRRRRRSAAEWMEVIDRQQRSGLSVAAFCRREDLGVASFYQWRSRLAGEDRQRPSPRQPRAGFVRLESAPAAPDRAARTDRPAAAPPSAVRHPHDGDPDAATVVARFPGGVELRVGGDLLADLVEALLDATARDEARRPC